MISNVTMKNTLQSGATLKRAEHSRSHVLIQHDYIISGGKDKEMIEKFLLEGKRNAIKSQKLADLTGCKSVRELQEVIAVERAKGAVILSICQNGGGYFLPSSGDTREVTEFIRTLQRRAENTLSALESAKAYLKQLEGDGDAKQRMDKNTQANL